MRKCIPFSHLFCLYICLGTVCLSRYVCAMSWYVCTSASVRLYVCLGTSVHTSASVRLHVCLGTSVRLPRYVRTSSRTSATYLVQAVDQYFAGVAADVGHADHGDDGPVAAVQHRVRQRDDEHPLKTRTHV